MYAQVISEIYRQQGFIVEDIPVAHDQDISSMMSRLSTKKGIFHFEVGAGDSAVFGIARKLLKKTSIQQVMTIHDTGQFIRHPISNSWTRSNSVIVRFAGKLIRKATSMVFGGHIRNVYLASNKVTVVYLRPDLAAKDNAWYLPQPMYHKVPSPPRKKTKQLTRAAFSGFWGQYKGLETIIEAWELGNVDGVELVIEGDVAEETDGYAKDIKRRLEGLRPVPELVGRARDLDAFLKSLSVLMVVYWPELPSGTSSMSLRAAELGIPIIASTTPALKEQLGEGPVYISPKDPQALREALISMQKDWDSVQQAALDLQVRIIHDHSWQAVGKSLNKLIDFIR